MPVRMETFGIHELSVLDKLELIDLLCESLPETVRPEEIPDWHLAEISRRRVEIEATPEVGTPWREALARFGDS
jgi:hypothetical protein